MSSQTRFRGKSSRVHHVKLAKRILLKAGSLDNAIQEFSLASPSWNLSQNTMLYTRNIMGRFYYFFFQFILLYFWVIFNKTIIQLGLADMANSYPTCVLGIIVK